MREGCGFEYEERGQGEAVLLIHGAILADTFAPLMHEGALSGFRRIRYRRRGYGGSVLGSAEPTIEAHARDALELLDHLGEERAHIVAHSGGGPIAVQMAVTRPDVVRSLVLLEPALQTAAMAEAFDDVMRPLVQIYDAGERAKAVHVFMRTATNPGWRAETEARLPGAAARAELDAAATFHSDLPALRRWDFDTVRERMTQPSLLIVGSMSQKKVERVTSMFRAAVPSAEFAVIDGVDHSLALTKPGAVAAVIVEFLRRHPFD